MLNIKSKIEKVHNDNDIDDVLKQWMVVLMPNEQINTQTTVKLHEIIVSEEKLDSQDNGSPLLSKQETTIFPEVPIEDIKDHQRETDNKETDDNNDVIEEMLMEQEMQNRLKQLENEVNKINQYSSEEEIISRIGLAKETNKRTKDDISSLYVDLSKMRYNVMNEIVKTNLMQKEFNRLLVQKDSEAAHMKHREDLVKDKIERRVVDVEELKKKHNDIIQSVSELEYQIVQLNFKTKDATEKLESAEQLNKDLVKELESKNDGIDALKILLTKSKQKQKENQRDCTRIRKQRKQIEADTMVVKSDKKGIVKEREWKEKKIDNELIKYDDMVVEERKMLLENVEVDGLVTNAKHHLKDVEKERVYVDEKDEQYTKRIKKQHERMQEGKNELDMKLFKTNQQRQQVAVEKEVIDDKLYQCKRDIEQEQKRIESLQKEQQRLNGYKETKKIQPTRTDDEYKKKYKKTQEAKLLHLKDKMKKLNGELGDIINDQPL